ncbi:MAG: pyridoxamine 5'-phosphate oxidase family protein [Treponema sp.]
MRRHEREVTDTQEINEVLEKSFVLHIGFNDKSRVYVVPVNFGYEEKDKNYVLYFHGARDGRKFNLISSGGTVGFECETDFELKTGRAACDYSAYYSSIIGEGIVSEIEGLEEKKSALNLIMKKVTGKSGWEYPNLMLEKTGVFKIKVTDMCCKKHKKMDNQMT